MCHITSLPSKFGIGDLGPAAYDFVDRLAQSRQRYWQILPLNPTEAGLGHSPYNSSSSYAGNPLVISPYLLREEGFLETSDLSDIPAFPGDFVDFAWVIEYKNKLIEKAFLQFNPNDAAYRVFLADNPWVHDFTLFVTLKKFFSNHPWNSWPQDIRDRESESLKYFSARHQSELNYVAFQQFIFFKQWRRLQDHCRRQGVQLIGDIPIYVSYDSADVWMNPDLFKLDADRKQTVVAGVPPDYFSETGQRWGNPVYDWNALKKQNFQWWVDRIRHNLKMFDVIRIDHFRGFVQYWEVPASEKTAIKGEWRPVPTREFLDKLLQEFPSCPIIAEDLGVITDDVREVMMHYGFPGMKILLFAFGDNEKNPYLPDNYSENSVVYVGTHDNNTARGWFEGDISDLEKRNLEKYLKKIISPGQVAWELTVLAFSSRANVAMIALQDLWNLDDSARMNIPGTTDYNWKWKCASFGEQKTWDRLADLTRRTGRDVFAGKDLK